MIIGILEVILRKVLFILLLWISYKLYDKYELKGLDTIGIIKNDPKALSMLLSSITISIAFA